MPTRCDYDKESSQEEIDPGRHDMKKIACLFVGTVMLIGCGGGGGGGSTAPPPPPTTGTASGKIVIPPSDHIEAEPNNSLAQAQSVPIGGTVSGAASVTDAGYTPPGLTGVVVADLFRITVSDPLQVTLFMAQDDLLTHDLDLGLFDSAGNVLDASEGVASVELINISVPGTYHIGVRAFSGSSEYLLSIASGASPTQQSVANIPVGAEFIPGDILIKWRSDSGAKSATPAVPSRALSRHGLVNASPLHTGAHRVQVALPVSNQLQGESGKRKFNLPGSKKNELKALTIDRIRRLRMDPDVEYAEPNYILRGLAIPNDQYFGYQWHYQAINLQQAWDISTGSENVIVAVLDSGLRLTHPDFAGRLVPGYDFISDPLNALDGDGIDPNPDDPGDDQRTPKINSSFHGTHVAGTIGAATNNSIGVAGVTWVTQIMPIRVSGAKGATITDVIQGLLAAARLPNASGALPAKKADIINMSLGGYGFSQTFQDAISQVRAQGVIVVAAAGNDNRSDPVYPASYAGVVSVSAVGPSLQKAPYSNYGRFLDVAAPGGDGLTDLNGDGFIDGILSTISNDLNQNFYSFLQGTSMSSPHVAGVFALMKSVYPNLTPTEVDQLLAGTHPLTTQRITRDLGTPGRDDIYGHGLIDAYDAVKAARVLSTAPPQTGSALAVSTSSLDLDSYINSTPLFISNTGTGTLQVTGVSGGTSWLSISPVTGVTPLRMEVRVNRSSLSPGTYTTTFQIQSDATRGASTASVQVTMIVPVSAALGNVGTVYVIAVDNNTLESGNITETDSSVSYAYNMPPVPPGTYYIVAGTDRDDDGFVCDIEDACGYYPDLVTIRAGQDVPNIDFIVSNFLLEPQSAGISLVPQTRQKYRIK